MAHRRLTAPRRIRTLLLTLLLASSSVAVQQSSAAPAAPRVPVPSLTGPVPVSASSRPFDATPVDLAAHGYVEQEFFLKGTANLYDYDANGKVVVTASNAPYTNRVVVRRPADPKKFSGSVVTEILNMTSGWDLNRMWFTSHDQYLRDGDAYVGVTSAPNTVEALRRYDPQRYADLSWADPRPAAERCTGTALNSSAATDGGLVWDIFSQVGAALKSHGRDNPLRGLDVEKVYATGYSQSGSYLVRYLNAIHPKARVYDGFLIAAVVPPRPLGKCSAEIPLADPRNIPRPTREPVIRVQTETDFFWDGGYSRRPDADTREDRYRLYEVPGSAHSYSYTASFQPSPEDLRKAGFTANYYNNCTSPGLSTDFPEHYLFNAMQVNLDAWARHDTPPPHAPRIQVDGDGRTVADEHGNALGGVRSPWLDVPIATYHPTTTPDSCRLQGHRVPFTTGQLTALYPDHGYYARAFMQETQRLVRGRWLTPQDGDAAVNTAANSSIPR